MRNNSNFDPVGCSVTNIARLFEIEDRYLRQGGQAWDDVRFLLELCNTQHTALEETPDLYAKVLEYEHALEHIAEHDVDTPDVEYCKDCTNLAKSALARDNKEDFLEIAKDFLGNDYP